MHLKVKTEDGWGVRSDEVFGWGCETFSLLIYAIGHLKWRWRISVECECFINICFVTLIVSDPPKVGITFDVFFFLFANCGRMHLMVFNFQSKHYLFGIQILFHVTIFGHDLWQCTTKCKRDWMIERDFGQWQCNGFSFVVVGAKNEITCKINHFWKMECEESHYWCRLGRDDHVSFFFAPSDNVDIFYFP